MKYSRGVKKTRIGVPNFQQKRRNVEQKKKTKPFFLYACDEKKGSVGNNRSDGGEKSTKNIHFFVSIPFFVRMKRIQGEKI